MINFYREVIFLIEREIASVIKFVIDTSGNPYPYYREIPEGFLIPAVYFPVPEIETDNDTLSSYKLTYIWFIKFFHKSTPKAYEMAAKVLKELKGGRNQIPIVSDKGFNTGKSFYVKNTGIKTIESGTVQFSIEWESRKLYTYEAVLKTRRYYIDRFVKN